MSSLVSGSTDESAPESGQSDEDEYDPGAVVGEYGWEEFFAEFDPSASRARADDEAFDWNTSMDLEELLGFSPGDPESVLTGAADRAARLDDQTYDTLDPEKTPVRKGEWTWHHFVRDCVDPEWEEPTLPPDFEPDEHQGGPGVPVENRLSFGHEAANVLEDVVDERTLDVPDDFDEDAFFRTDEGDQTIVTRYDLEKAVPMEKKADFREIERYWVNRPYAFVTIYHSEKENETKYYLIEPYLTPIEQDLLSFLTGKLRTSIKYADEIIADGDESRREVIDRETKALLERYDIYEEPSEDAGFFARLQESLPEALNGAAKNGVSDAEPETTEPAIEGITARPEPALVEENRSTLSEYQVEKLLYRLIRDFIGYQRIDGVKHDINIEDISCDGYNSPVFVYHTEYEQIISNIEHGKERLDDFVVKLAQRSGKGISKRQPQVDATLPDGSRAQLTLGKEVSDHGTNYTIRQFNDVPFTPIDLINWRTFSLEQMAFLWLCIENHKSLIFAGGTASGKTTSLNAVSLFIPSASKIVSIEDTREVELPQRNWIASVTRPSFSDDEKGDVDEFDLLEAALRQRPEYIVMGEIRGEEGRTLFQVMSTGHTTYTTFHADSVGEVLKRFTTDPINVSKTMFTALDLVSIQTSTRVRGKKVRRNKSLTEINHYDPENDEINVQDIYQWEAESDDYRKMGESNILDEILFDRGWDRERLETELFKREIVLAYLIENGLNQYQQVAATLQAFITDPDTTMGLIANDTLAQNLEDLREMESVEIDIDPEKEALVPRPDPDAEMREQTSSILERAEDELFDEYEESPDDTLADALESVEPPETVTVEPADTPSMAHADGGDVLADDPVGTDTSSPGDSFEGDTPQEGSVGTEANQGVDSVETESKEHEDAIRNESKPVDGSPETTAATRDEASGIEPAAEDDSSVTDSAVQDDYNEIDSETGDEPFESDSAVQDDYNEIDSETGDEPFESDSAVRDEYNEIESTSKDKPFESDSAVQDDYNEIEPATEDEPIEFDSASRDDFIGFDSTAEDDSIATDSTEVDEFSGGGLTAEDESSVTDSAVQDEFIGFESPEEEESNETSPEEEEDSFGTEPSEEDEDDDVSWSNQSATDDSDRR